jgi:hypothetical protein
MKNIFSIFSDISNLKFNTPMQRKTALLIIMSEMVQSVYGLTIDGDSDLCNTFETNCRDWTVSNGTDSVEVKRRLEYAAYYSKKNRPTFSMEHVRACLDTEMILEFSEKVVRLFGFGSSACIADASYANNKIDASTRVVGINTQDVDCDQLRALWEETVTSCASPSEYLDTAAKIGIAVGTLAFVALCVVAIYLACKKGKEFAGDVIQHIKGPDRAPDVDVEAQPQLHEHQPQPRYMAATM